MTRTLEKTENGILHDRRHPGRRTSPPARLILVERCGKNARCAESIQKEQALPDLCHSDQRREVAKLCDSVDELVGQKCGAFERACPVVYALGSGPNQVCCWLNREFARGAGTPSSLFVYTAPSLCALCSEKDPTSLHGSKWLWNLTPQKPSLFRKGAGGLYNGAVD